MRPMNFVLSSLLIGLFLMLSACAGGAVPAGGGTIDPVSDTPQVVETFEYRVGNGDELRISVFGEPELTGDYTVDGLGELSMPLIGSVAVNGLTVQELQSRIADRLAQGYLVNPRVSAEVTSFRPYYILGEVNRPNEYPYISGLTVMNAVAAAGGFTYRANRRDVFIRSVGDTDERRVTITTTTPVQPGDTIRIGERIF